MLFNNLMLKVAYVLLILILACKYIISFICIQIIGFKCCSANEFTYNYFILYTANYQSVWCQNRIVGGKQINIQNVPYMVRSV